MHKILPETWGMFFSAWRFFFSQKNDVYVYWRCLRRTPARHITRVGRQARRPFEAPRPEKHVPRSIDALHRFWGIRALGRQHGSKLPTVDGLDGLDGPCRGLCSCLQSSPPMDKEPIVSKWDVGEGLLWSQPPRGRFQPRLTSSRLATISYCACPSVSSWINISTGKAETKKLLDIVAKSLYTDKEAQRTLACLSPQQLPKYSAWQDCAGLH